MAQVILTTGDSVVGASLSPAGHLIVTKASGATSDLGMVRGAAASTLPALAARLRSPSAALPTQPTESLSIDWGSDVSLAKFFTAASPQITFLGNRPPWDTWRYRADGAYFGMDVIHTGQNIEFVLVEQVANNMKTWIFVDGAPITPTPTAPGVPTASGYGYHVRLGFDTVARRRITIHTDSAHGVQGVATDMTDTLTPAPPLPRVAFVGDSFMDGSNGAPRLQAVAVDLARLFDVNPLIGATGGTGYIAGGSDGVHQFGSADRIAQLVAFKPELIVVVGSVNDDGSAGIQAAASAYYAALNTSLPGVPVIVFGPQPSSASGTISTGRAANGAALKAAAAAAPNVLAFFDMVGTASGTVPPAFATFQARVKGERVTYLGSVWEVVTDGSSNTGPYVPGQDANWAMVTYGYSGTGQVGSPAGDGSRDLLLYSDSVHPTVAGAMALADRIAREVRAVLGGTS